MARRRSFMIGCAASGAIALVMAACTGTPERSGIPGIEPRHTEASDVLVVGTADGAMVIDVATALPLSEGAATLTAPDGSRLYATSTVGDTTTLTTRDAPTGAVLAETELDGRFDARVASMSGEIVALMEPLPDGVGPWTPIPRSSTTIVIADPSGQRPARHLTLDGNFEPEAFSADDRSMFLIQHLPAEAPAAYRVTVLDLAGGEIRPVRGRFKVPPQRMPGTRLRQSFDPSRGQLYTLYTNEARTAADAWGHGSDGGTYGGGGASGDGGYGDEGARAVTFIHVLNLRNGWAFCAGVPRSFWGRPPRALALATSPDGSILYLVDAAGGRVAEMDTRSLEIVRTHEVDLGSREGVRTSAVVGADGGVLYVGSALDGDAIHAFATDTFEPLGRWTVGSAVHDVAVSNDGERLYAALEDAIALLDPLDGSSTLRLPLGGIDEILRVTTPE